MRLLEFQAKQLFREYGIPVPEAKLVTSTGSLTEEMFPAVLKAQVPLGGRGRAGAIRHAHSFSEGVLIVDRMLGMGVKGYTARALLVEQPLPPERELFLALLVDWSTGQPMIMASPQGGVAVEQIAHREPAQMAREQLDPCIGPQGYAIRRVAKVLGIGNVTGLSEIIEAMYRILVEHDATLVEINPLAVDGNRLVALDAKVVLDGHAAFRHAGRWAGWISEQDQLVDTGRGPAELLAQEHSITYVPAEGDLAIVADGAGTGMYAFDAISELGGRPANFCELGIGTPERMQQAIEVVVANPRARVLFITLIGGLTRMDDMADGVIRYLQSGQRRVPMVVRMCGTQEEVGRARLDAVGIDTFDDFLQAARKAVELSRMQGDGNSR